MLTPGMAVLVCVCVNQKAVLSLGLLRSQQRQGGGGWECLVYRVRLVVSESFWADNKAVTNE